MIRMLLSTLFTSFIFTPLVFAAATNKNADGSCDLANSQLQVGTFQLTTDCGDTFFCNPKNSKCEPKGCRKDEFPLGYDEGAKLPEKCKPGSFCPDEGDACQPLLQLGEPCQLNRDDECTPPPNPGELRDPLGFRNIDGAVCLNFQCVWANRTLGQNCTTEQMAYIAYSGDNQEFIYVSSRDDCHVGLYCDAKDKVCEQQKDFGAACTADKECSSNNCLSSLTCGNSPEAPAAFPTWVYVVVGLGILIGMFGTLSGLYLLHRKTRDEEREKRIQYWREQNAFRQNILQMRDTAKASLLSLSLQGDTPRSTIYGRDHIGSEDSGLPMLRRHSGLRVASDDGHDSIHGETPILLPADHELGGWGQRPAARRPSQGRRI